MAQNLWISRGHSVFFLMRRLLVPLCALLTAVGICAATPWNAAPSEASAEEVAVDDSTSRVVTDRPTFVATATGSAILANRAVEASGLSPFTSIGISFRSDMSAVAVVRVERSDGSWSPAHPLDLRTDEAPDRTSAEFREMTPSSGALYVGEATGYRIEFPADAADIGVHRVERGPSRAAVVATDPTSMLGRLGVNSRAAWGAKPSKKHPGLGNAENGVRIVVIHHTATADDYLPSDVPKILRDLQAYDQNVRSYDDLGYNVMVDRFGGVWEGRFGGLDRQVIGAHAQGYNSVSMGIAVLGNFSDEDPAPAVVDVLAKLAGWKMALGGYDPTSTVTITDQEADGHPAKPVPLTIPRIVGHQHVGQTACPATIANFLNEIRQKAAAYAERGVGTLEPLVDNGDRTISVSGWASRTFPDPATPSGPANVLLRLDHTIENRLIADQSFDDQDDGFVATFPALPGPHRVCAYEISDADPPPTGLEPTRLIGCQAITVHDTQANPIRPVRLFDSRSTTANRLTTAGTRALKVAGAKTVPVDAVAVAMNVTVTGSAAAGFLTVHPCNTTGYPTTSNVNFQAGQTIAAMVLTKLSSTGEICLFSSTPLEAIVDITAWFPPAGAFEPTEPTRLVDTRLTKNPLSRFTERVVTVRGRAGVVSNATAVALNVVAVDPRRDGWLVVYPCDKGRGTASSVNFVTGKTIANLTVAKLSATGTVCLYADAATDVIVDVTGSFTSESSYTPIAPTRILDTRIPLMHPRLEEDDTVEVSIRGKAGIPDDALAVVANVTVTNGESEGFVTLYPCAQVFPGTSNVNYAAGQSIPNLTFTKIGENGCVRLYTQKETDVIVDVVGYLR